MPLAKQALRKQLLAERRAVPIEEKRAADEKIFARVIALKVWQEAQTVFLYCSSTEEIDTSRLLSAALQVGKRVCVPLCTAVRGVMEAREITAVSQLSAGKYGILEPPPEALCVPPEAISLCIVPCLSADAMGHRLGYGGGYYDRFLAQTEAQSVVLCAESRFTDTLPAEAHDHRCGMIVTERRVHIARKG